MNGDERAGMVRPKSEHRSPGLRGERHVRRHQPHALGFGVHIAPSHCAQVPLESVPNPSRPDSLVQIAAFDVQMPGKCLVRGGEHPDSDLDTKQIGAHLATSLPCLAPTFKQFFGGRFLCTGHVGDSTVARKTAQPPDKPQGSPRTVQPSSARRQARSKPLRRFVTSRRSRETAQSGSSFALPRLREPRNRMHIHSLGINGIGPLPQEVGRQTFPVRLVRRLPDNQRVGTRLGQEWGWGFEQQAPCLAPPAKAASTGVAAMHARHLRCPRPASPALAALLRERQPAARFADLLFPSLAARYIAGSLLSYPRLDSFERRVDLGLRWHTQNFAGILSARSLAGPGQRWRPGPALG